MRDKAGWSQYAQVYLIVGLVFIGLGIMPLANGLYGYYVTLPEIERSQETVNEKAEELGLGDIPGVSVDDFLVRFFTVMILIGCTMIVIGVVLLTISLRGKSESAEKRP